MPRSSQLDPAIIRAGFQRWFVGEENSEGEQRAYCPICEDPEESHSPSAMFNIDEDMWNCLKGNHGGSITSLARDLKKERGTDVRAIAREARPSKRKAKGEPPSPVAVNNWHEALLDNATALKAFMKKRGLDKESIEEFEIGWDASCGRYTIPIYDENGNLVNVRKYKMNIREGEQKFWNHPGYGDARIYGIEELKESDWVIHCEGELDRLLSMQLGFPTTTGTGGSGTFPASWAPHFTDKIVFLCYDPDEAGDKGAMRAANALKHHARVVYQVKLPAPHDLTDFYTVAGKDPEDFEELMEEARLRGAKSSKQISSMPVKGQKASLIDSMSPDLGNEPIQLIVSVTGKQQEPFTAPKIITANCSMDKGIACETCPIQARDGQMTVETEPHDTRLPEFIDVTSTQQHKLLRMLTGARCSDRVQFSIDDLWRIEELSVQNSIDERVDDVEEKPIRRTVWSVGTFRSEANQKRRLVGTNVQDPKNGVLKFQSWINEPVELDIDRYELNPDLRERLSIFQPSKNESPLDKCMDIAEDLAANITLITGRTLLHVGMDLVFHSPLAFRVLDKDVAKGWLEMIVVGDTRTGKSEIATRLIEHYGAGRLISCEGVSFAGIIGGVQQINGRWHMTWGAVPMNDRRLVVLDEVSGMADKNVIEQMSSVRSAGVAQVTKIAAESTSARTRLIWISNPMDGRYLASNRQGGIGALHSVVPNMEDIARFDFAMAAARGDVSAEDINSELRPGPSGYPAEDCEMLVKWAWSLTRDDVHISSDAVAAASVHAIAMGERYIPDPPLVQTENVRFKILRIACALAARTFSVTKDDKLLVLKIHVDDAVRFLDEIYGQDSLGYARASQEEFGRVKHTTGNVNKAKAFFESNPDVYRILNMNRTGTFRVRDFREFAGMDDSEASSIAAQLQVWGYVSYGKRGDWEMTQELISLLEEIRKEK